MHMDAGPDRLQKSHVYLILLVSTASFFEGYDFIILNLVLPFLQKEFSLSILQAGLAVSAIAVGTIAAFLVLRLGDYFGRKALLMWTVLGYTIATALTAASRSIYGFVAMQFLARVFLVAEWGISTVIIAEELPAAKRGIGISVVQAMAGVGAVVGSAIFPIVAKVALGWRAMYLIGIVPLVIVFFIRSSLHETRRYAELRRTSPDKPKWTEILGPKHRKNLVLMALIWLFMYMGYTPLQTFYTSYAIKDVGLSEGQVGLIIAVAFILGLSGYFAAGKLMDAWGRKPTCVLFFSVGSISTALAFNAPHELWAMGLTLVVGIFFSTSYLPIVSTYTTELFPTRLRASASAWTNNTLGRIGMVLAPTFVGLLANAFANPTGGAGGRPLSGLGPAVSILGLSPLLCALFVLIFLPETKQRELEEISR
jgi:MFS transporter, putative metabolite:H+ symporter